jgi:hypothetical protein
MTRWDNCGIIELDLVQIDSCLEDRHVIKPFSEPVGRFHSRCLVRPAKWRYPAGYQGDELYPMRYVAPIAGTLYNALVPQLLHCKEAIIVALGVHGMPILLEPGKRSG